MNPYSIAAMEQRKQEEADYNKIYNRGVQDCKQKVISILLAKIASTSNPITVCDTECIAKINDI